MTLYTCCRCHKSTTCYAKDWEEMAEGEKLVVLLGGGGARASTFLRGILEKRRRWIGVGGFRGF